MSATTLRLTPAQRIALEYVRSLKTDGDTAWMGMKVRRDVLGRLHALGLATVRMEFVHAGSTYRSKQIYVIADVNLTDAGREVLGDSTQAG